MGETGQWFATFDVGSVFQDIRFKELCNGDLLRIQYEEKQNGKYQDLVLKSVSRPQFPEEPAPESKDKGPEQDEPDSEGPGAQEPKKQDPALSDYFHEAQEAVLGIVESLDPKKKRPPRKPSSTPSSRWAWNGCKSRKEIKMENYPLYNGEITLCFDPGRHRYYVNGEWVPGVTGAVGVIDKSAPLMWWAVNQSLDYLRIVLKSRDPV